MMNRRLSMILALCAGLVLALPAVTSAQTARVAGLAVQGDYIKDYTGIYTYTSQVSNVGNLIYGELGNIGGPPPVTSDRAVGAVLGNLWDGRWGTWAMHLREETPQLGQGDAGTQPAPGIGADPNFNQFESFDLMWGKKFGTKSIGLRLNRSFGGQEFTGNDVVLGVTKNEGGGNLQRNILGLGAGVGFEVNPTTNVELNFAYQSRTYLVENPTTPAAASEEDGPATYQVAARGWWQWRPDVMIVPVFKYYSYDLATKTGTTITDNSLKGWQAGFAGNWALGSNDLFVMGWTFARNTRESLDATLKQTETFAPQVFAGLETHLNSWLTARFGANKAAWHTFKDEDTTVLTGPGSTESKGRSTFNWALGAGLKFGNLQIDATLDDQFPHNMPYFISGNSTPGMFPKVTATYPF